MNTATKLTIAEPPAPETVCVIENCGKIAKWKGLCGACYGQAKGLINEEQTTWEELGQLGLAVIPDKPFIAAFKKAKGIVVA